MTLQRKTGARWVDVQSVKPDAGGRFSLRLWPGEGAAVFRVSRAAQDRSTRAVSGWIRARGVEPSVCVQPLAGDAELRQSLRDRLARSSEHPVVIVGAGSSTTSGSGASQEMNRWLNRFAAALSADFDLSGNLPAPVLRQDAFGWSEPRETSGIHVVNVGVGGATSESYLLRGSPETRLSRVAGLAPDIVVHFVGSNDYRKSRDPVADYTPDLRRSIEELDGLLEGGEKPIHVLVHAYRPMRPTGLPFPWAAYRDAMAQVAAEDPERRVSIDLSKWFTDAGATASDPWNLIRGDLVHPTDAGHEALDGLIRRALDLNRDC
nr:SGNH/GDSL hydrolase family protein [Leucobacter weissii]